MLKPSSICGARCAAMECLKNDSKGEYVMTINAGYAIWGGALFMLCTLLLVISVMKLVKRLKFVLAEHDEKDPFENRLAGSIEGAEHRALMFVMDQKLDSVLSAIAQTIEKERQKLGVVNETPSIDLEADEDLVAPVKLSNRLQSAYQQVGPLAKNGTSLKAIAKQLELSEAEVSLVMRLDAA